MRPEDLEHISNSAAKVYCDRCHTWQNDDGTGEPVDHECEEYIPTLVDLQELDFDD